jgi:lipopolysaccharide/colanic/teichoic acid biosynthesis glycosyltransferase
MSSEAAVVGEIRETYIDRRGNVTQRIEHTDYSSETSCNTIRVDLPSDSTDVRVSLDYESTEFAKLCKEKDSRSLGFRFVKRSFDILFSGVVCLLGVIPGAVLSIAIAIDTKGAPIYSQERVGRCGKSFRIYKFRSMAADADQVEKYLNQEQLHQWNTERKVDNDPRITRFGRLLRSTSIDEFPQFINVFRGDISIIGPRPITYHELEWFGSNASELLSVPAGITGAWQCGPRNDVTFENGRRQQIELDYANNASLSRDASIFFKTFAVMFLKRTGR